MRIALAASLILAVAAAGAYAAFGRGDDLADIDIPEVAMESGRAHHFDVRAFAEGLNRPTWVGGAPGEDALWVLEQPGQVKLGAEQGLLGIAFHPDFATDRRLYLHWSDPSGDTSVAEFRAGRDGTIDPQPLRELLHVEQPEENHNGGQLLFGPDGRLYLGLGDG